MKNMNLTKLYWIFFGILIVFTSCDDLQDNNSGSNHPKYVFYFIGDGMSQQHIKLTEAFLYACNKDEPGYNKLAFDTLPASGSSTTHAANRLITGSAAAGTALATGHKTNIGHIALAPGGSEKYQSIADVMYDDGKKIGIITNVSIDHATPAVFYAHCKNRKQYFDIGKQMAESGFDFFGGGGFLEPEKNDTNLYNYLEENDYRVIREKNGISQIKAGEKTVLVNPVLGNDAEMPYAIDRKYEGGYSLAEMTRAAIENLYADEGFFIMVEGGKIDWAAHANDAATIIREVIDFDKAVQQALSFYAQHPDETLIVVTSDHETGGLALGNAEMKYQTNFALLKKQRMSVEKLSALLQNGEIDETELPGVFGLENLTSRESLLVDKAKNHASDDVEEIEYGGYEPLPVTYNQILNTRAGTGFTTWKHTAAPVPVYAIGKGSETFSGQMDNTGIPKKIMQAAGYDFPDN
ncbi:MAG: alkaline phosphatase [Bacteroidota bacterium]